MSVPPVSSKKPPHKKAIMIITGVVIVMAAIAWFVVRSRAAAPPPYRLASVEVGNIRQTVSATGTVGAVKTVQVGTRVSGQVIELHADFNDHVIKGQLLARIDPTLQQQAVTDALAQLAKSQTQYDQAKAQFDRNEPLFKQQFLSASDFSTIQVALAVALAGVKSGQVTLEEARQNLAYTNIFAPINGVVVARNVDVGQTVAASLSAPQLFLIAQDLSKIQILAAVDESDIAAIKDSQAVTFTVQAYPDLFTARVGQVRLQSQITDNVVNYTVVVAVDNSDGRLLPGMTATVEFITGAAMQVLTVPNLALRYKPTPAQLLNAGITASDTTRNRLANDSTGGTPGGARGGAGTAGTPSAASARPKRAATSGAGSRGTLYTLDAAGKLKVVHVLVGLSDGQRTEVKGELLSAGMQVIVGVGTGPAAATTTAPSTNPLTPQRGAGGRGGP